MHSTRNCVTPFDRPVQIRTDVVGGHTLSTEAYDAHTARYAEGVPLGIEAIKRQISHREAAANPLGSVIQPEGERAREKAASSHKHTHSSACV